MNPTLSDTVSALKNYSTLSQVRKEVLAPLIASISEQIALQQPVRLNFICTHNSRRSHLAQIWMQVAAYHFGITNVVCYSGGTTATALYPTVVQILEQQGFTIQTFLATSNPLYSIKYADNELPIMGFSKLYTDEYNPKSDFIAITTCSSADADCPFVVGAKQKIAIPYQDPSMYDLTEKKQEGYWAKSIEIASEMFYVMSKVKECK